MEVNQENYTTPEFQKTAFNCPTCNAYAHQTWNNAPFYDAFSSPIVMLRVATCIHCKNFSFWINKELIYPPKITAPLAHKDMPKPVLGYYNEARQVSVSSPRAAAALLRIAAKKLCETLEETESNLNLAIGNLRKKGLPESVITSLDTVRIVGNEGGAHEGQIDLTGKDNKQIVDKLFWLINFIVQKTITEPQEVKDMFASLPEDKRQGVADRDKNK